MITHLNLKCEKHHLHHSTDYTSACDQHFITGQTPRCQGNFIAIFHLETIKLLVYCRLTTNKIILIKCQHSSSTTGKAQLQDVVVVNSTPRINNPVRVISIYLHQFSDSINSIACTAPEVSKQLISSGNTQQKLSMSQYKVLYVSPMQINSNSVVANI